MPDAFGNPLYQTLPTTPPGLDGLRYLIGGPVAQLMGGMMAPYVPVNQSVFDTRIATFQNDPLYRSMMAGVSAQMFGQMGRQLAAMPLAQSFAGMAGYTPQQFQQAMVSGPSAFGRSMMGSAVMPMIDAAMANAGLTPGSYVQAAQTMYNNRMAFLSPGVRINPFDSFQQHQAMSGAAAMMNAMNGLITGNGVTPNYTVTQGFDRGQIANWVTQAAAYGAYNQNGMGYAARMLEATGGKDKYGLNFDIRNLDWGKGDFTGGGVDSNLSAAQAEKVRKVQDEVNSTTTALVQVMGAMRDMLKTTDGTFEKLMAMTNGEALTSRANMRNATGYVRRLDAMTKAYNLDPDKAWGQLMQNRALLQDAAGFDENMRFYGFDGGGMFRLGGQTEFLASVEDAITARGIRGNAVLESRYRNQARQAFARNMNTQAGAMASLLAYARQTGMVSDDDALKYREGLMSGDRSEMESTINRLLVTTFGSKERGRQFMQDATFVNSMRQSMDDRAGAFANQTIIRGADAEMSRRERITLAENRLAFSKSALRNAGVSAVQTDEGIGLIVDSIVGELNGKESGVGDAFRAEYERRIASGASPRAAQQATVASFKRDPVYGKYAETITTAVKERSALNNETRLIDLGPESFQAKAMAEQLHRSGVITGERYSQLTERLKRGDRLEAQSVLSELDSTVSGLDAASQKRFSVIRSSGKQAYDAVFDTINIKRYAKTYVDKAREIGFGADRAVEAHNATISALKDYAASDKSEGAYDDLAAALGNSDFRTIYGQGGVDRLLTAAKTGSIVDPATGKTLTLDKMIERMGRASFDIKQTASSTLTKNGWGLGMSGFWGGGFYAGNKESFLHDRDALLDKLAKSIHRDAIRYAGDRSTLAQDFLKVLESGDPKKLLRLYDVDGSLEQAIGSDYFMQFAEVEKLRAGADDAHATFAGIVKRMRDSGKYREADDLVQMINDAGLKKVTGGYEHTDKSFIKQLADGKITDSETVERFMTALGSQRKLAGAEDRLKELAVGAISKEGMADRIRGWSASKKAAEQDKALQDSKVSDISKFWSGLDHSDVSQFVNEGAMRDAYTAMYDVVSDDDLKAAFGGVKSLEGFSESALNKKAFEIMKTKVSGGDKDAIAAMDKMGVAMKESQALKVKGEITLKNGNDSQPGILDFIIGKA